MAITLTAILRLLVILVVFFLFQLISALGPSRRCRTQPLRETLGRAAPKAKRNRCTGTATTGTDRPGAQPAGRSIPNQAVGTVVDPANQDRNRR